MSLCKLTVSAVWLSILTGINAAASAPVDYAAKIAPLFQEHCVDCHGHDDPDGELNMESFENLMRGGKAGKVFSAGDAENSLIVKFLEGRSGKEGKNRFMPPGKKEHLKPEEIALEDTQDAGRRETCCLLRLLRPTRFPASRADTATAAASAPAASPRRCDSSASLRAPS